MEEKVMDMTMINRDKFKEYVIDCIDKEITEATEANPDDAKIMMLIMMICTKFAHKLEGRIFGDDSTD